MNNLANEYAEYKPIAQIMDFVAMGLNKNFAKMVSFCEEHKINNDIIDQVMAIKPARLEEESRDDYKNRQRFQKYLLKYRSYIYDYNKLK
jgi:hypothetical protein